MHHYKRGHQNFDLHSPWLMLAVAWAFVLYQFFLQLSAGILIPPLIKTFHFSALQAGLIAGSFYIVYVLLQTPAGMLVDAVGPRRLLTGGGLLCGLGCLLFSASQSMTLLFIGRMMMGAGASFAFVSSLYIIDHGFPENRFAKVLGIIETIGMVGTLAANVYFAELLIRLPWQSVMAGAAAVAFIIAILSVWIVRDAKEGNDLEPRSVHRFLNNAKWAIKNKSLWVNGIYGGLHFSTVTVFAALWGLPYLILAQHITMPEATLESSMIYVGIGVGAPIMGWLFETMEHRNRFLMWMGLSSAVLCSWLIDFTPQSVWLSGILFFLIGFVCSCYVFNYSLANLSVPKGMRSTAVGFHNSLVVGTAPILQPLIGWQLSMMAAKHNQLGLAIYTLSDYHWALSIMPIALVLGAMLAPFIPPPLRSPKSV